MVFFAAGAIVATLEKTDVGYHQEKRIPPGNFLSILYACRKIHPGC